MIDIKEILNSPNGTKETLDFELPGKLFDMNLQGDVQIQAELLRVDEGIMFLPKEINATQLANCVKCGKELELNIHTQPSEWLFYKRPPMDYDDHNEIMRIDISRYEIDPTDAIRQELLLHEDPAPKCKKGCTEFEEPDPGVKSLKGLKELIDKKEQ